MKYTVEDMIAFLNQFEDEKLLFFTGGEPLLYQHFESLLEQLGKWIPKVSFGMFTTGIINKNGELMPVTEEMARKLKKAGVSICCFSIYSHKELEHDWMTGEEGSFRMTKAAIANFQKAEIQTRFNSVVTKKNKNSFQKIIDMASEWGISEVRLLKLIKSGRAVAVWEEIGISEEDYREVVEILLKGNSNVRITASGLPDLLPCRSDSCKSGCQAGSGLLYVTYEGDIFPCASVKNNKAYRLGNIKCREKTICCLKDFGILCS